ncbi:DUF5667 domain-containing protein [Clostridium kluyveri]|uniref:DUF5667 domain-containing protein n=1 Tax=Clostridium kluyveri TaxID=1534 RepID=A0A1L5F7G1_CLOKL|nr:DUF5667 domain-containing protein [Clostridium kluyveri]APM38929.1 hypothetical protein BS101_09315 [Clostridium kluyveri]
MKKITILAASVIMTLSIGGTTFAANTATLKDRAGITPDSILYPADKRVDSIKVTLCFSDETKADKLSQIAQERLGESEVMVSKNKKDLADTALNDYQSNMDAAENKIEDAINNNQTVDNQDKLKKLEYIESKITDKQKKSLDVLAALQNKVGDKAKDVVAKVIEMQTAKRDAILALKKERTVYNNTKKQYNEAKAAIEKAKKSGDETTIKTAEDLLQQKQQALDIEKQNLTKAIETKKEASKISVGKLIKETKEQTKKDSQNNENTQTGETSTTTSTTTDTTTTDTTADSTVTNSTSVTSKNAKKQTSEPTIKSETKNVVTDNKNKKENKTNNVNEQKKEKTQH